VFLSKSQLQGITSAKALLEGHHSRPLYSLPMTWWNQQHRQQRNPKGKAPHGQGKNQEVAKGKGSSPFPAYDAGSVEKEPAGGSSGASSSASTTMDPQLLQVLKQLAASHPSAADQINCLLPDPDQQEIKDQQKRINVLRRLQQRVTKKEAQIKLKEQQMEQFIEQMKSHVLKEKLRHKEELDVLRKDIEQTKIDIQKVKEGDHSDPTPSTEMDLEEILDSPRPDPEKDQLKEQLVKAEQANYAMQQQLHQFQGQMAEFMQVYRLQLPPQEGQIGTPPGLPMTGVTSPGQHVKPPVNVAEATPGSMTTKRDAKQPFGIARKEKETASPGPYGRPKDPPTERGGALEGMDI